MDLHKTKYLLVNCSTCVEKFEGIEVFLEENSMRLSCVVIKEGLLLKMSNFFKLFSDLLFLLCFCFILLQVPVPILFMSQISEIFWAFSTDFIWVDRIWKDSSQTQRPSDIYNSYWPVKCVPFVFVWLDWDWLFSSECLSFLLSLDTMPFSSTTSSATLMSSWESRFLNNYSYHPSRCFSTISYVTVIIGCVSSLSSPSTQTTSYDWAVRLNRICSQ